MNAIGYWKKKAHFHFGLLQLLHLCSKTLKLGIFVIYDCELDEAIPKPIQCPKVYLDLEVPTIEPHTLL